MRRELHLRGNSSAALWRVALCVTLAALFLYNPFLAVYGTSPIANIQHPLSYRATVAGSELQTCTVAPEGPLAPALEVAVAREGLPAAATTPVWPALTGDTIRPVRRVICNSLWFRPPPVS